MDAFKAIEIERMRLGGNDGWRRFYEQHPSIDATGITWDNGTDPDRYTGEVGEEWKERLTCKVEGKEYVPSEKKSTPAPVKKPAPTRSTPRSGTPLSGTASRSESPGQGSGGAGGKVKVDDTYFARLGADNATRPDNVPPSQGGKYGGFGNTPGPASQSQGSIPTFDDVQKDPMAAITKGFGWFTSTVSKTAKNVNDGYLQPASKQVWPGLCCWVYTSSPKADTIDSLPRATLPGRPRLRPRSWPSRHSRRARMRRRGSAGLSRAAMRAAGLRGRGRRWMRTAGASGTTSRGWRSRDNRATTPSGRARWGWGRAGAGRLRRSLRSRTMSGMIGEGGRAGCVRRGLHTSCLEYMGRHDWELGRWDTIDSDYIGSPGFPCLPLSVLWCLYDAGMRTMRTKR